jgi:hypothetical protein
LAYGDRVGPEVALLPSVEAHAHSVTVAYVHLCQYGVALSELDGGLQSDRAIGVSKYTRYTVENHQEPIQGFVDRCRRGASLGQAEIWIHA